ncbi:sublancin family glycopeptide [Kitasatospora purpeofusca]|uniref:sublancin family glycopeptide n=1 Tax=Kitasatospora purpeofusca TaxID=67352 RepID=UPI002A5ACBE6|nr:sublancin family glycopeptide [Kitasatospora purpeofusca]MDY0811084.1 sublancin family glycopeptide [Kitasatospora purpeofusca]
MTLSELRALGFPELTETEAESAAAEGLSAAQCAYIWTLATTSAVISCGGTPSDYMAIYNRECR